MRKFEVDVVYSGSIRVIVEAADEYDAKRTAQKQVEKMPDSIFHDTVDLGWSESNIVEEIIE